jgi:predicted RNase H-like HicB family nuclease
LKKVLTARIWTEGDWVIAQCPEIDDTSHGHSEKEALHNLQEAVELYFEPLDNSLCVSKIEPIVLKESSRGQ